ncbi:MAG: hypothetical protein ACKOD9_16730, partial [Rubrivivax sp.]
MKTLRITALTIAVLTAFPAAAQSHAEVLAELQALKARVAELESQLKAQSARTPPTGAQWGMTPDQARELNRITVKAEAMEDARDAAGLKLLKI